MLDISPRSIVLGQVVRWKVKTWERAALAEKESQTRKRSNVVADDNFVYVGKLKFNIWHVNRVID